jgi:hypothetical protein
MDRSAAIAHLLRSASARIRRERPDLGEAT